MIKINDIIYESVDALINLYIPIKIKKPFVRVEVHEQSTIVFIATDQSGYNLENETRLINPDLYFAYLPLACGLVADMLNPGYYYIYFALDKETCSAGTIGVRRFDIDSMYPEAYIWNFILSDSYKLETVDAVITDDSPEMNSTAYFLDTDQAVNQAVSELSMQIREPWDPNIGASNFVSASFSIHVSNGRAIRRYMTTDKIVEFRNRRIL